MEYIFDFHIHSKFARATSKNMVLPELDIWANKKGIKVLGTGDFTHPVWFSHLKENLQEAEQGLYKVKNSNTGVLFMLTSEVSCIYSQGGKVRRVHLLIFAPSFEVAEKINKELSKIGDLASDGRPILGISAKNLAKIVFNASKDCLVVCAHAWTPWFSVFGSKSGFDSLQECFEEMTPYIYAIETGLSSDPEMNWRIPELDNVAIISSSDAHSPQKIGREATVFNLEKVDYYEIINSIKQRKNIAYTIEFFPEEGKYHYDGHRLCGIKLTPEQTKKFNGICPKCKKPLTVGVMYRVEELAKRPQGFKPEGAPPFKKIIPLQEIIADVMNLPTTSKKVLQEYENLIKNVGPEFYILLKSDIKDLQKVTMPEIAKGIDMVREGKVFIDPGYDGVFGKIKIELPKEKEVSQKSLF